MNERTSASAHDQGLQEPRHSGAEPTDGAWRPGPLRGNEPPAGDAAHLSEDVRHLEAALADELALHQRVHEISCRLIPADDVRTIYSELVDAAIDLSGAGGGTMQAVDQATGELILLEARRIPASLLRKGRRVAPDSSTSCALALRGPARVFVDYETDERVAGSPEAAAHLDAGIRAAQSTPLVSRSGEVVGMLSTHWHEPHVLPEHRGRLLDIIARQAADLIERLRAEEALRESEQRLRIATAAAGVGLHDFDVQAGTVEWDQRTREIWGVDPDEPITFDLWRDSLHPDDVAAAEAAVQRATDPSGDGRYVAEYRVTNRRDGQERWVLALGQAIFVDGVPVRLVGTAQEITTRKRAEEELLESRQRLRLALEAGRLGDWYLDLETGQAVTSLRHDQCFGATEPFEEWGYDIFLGFVHPDDRIEVQRRFDQAVGTQGDWHFECRVIWSDESVHWIESRGTVHLDAQGEPRSMLGVVHDITARKQREEELRNRSEQLETLTHRAPLGIYLVDADLRLAHVNPVAQPVFGNVPDLIGRRFDELLELIWGPERGAEIMAIFQRTLETGEPFHVPEFAEYRHDRGIPEYYDWRVDRIVLPDGKHGVVCYFRDVSDQVRAREEIAHSEARYRSLFESIDEGFAVLEMIFDGERPVDYRFIETNPAFERHTGLVDAHGKRASEMVADLEDHWFETYGRVARTGQSVRFVNYAHGMDERWFDVFAFRPETDEPDRVALLFKDITEQKRTMRQLEDLNRTLEDRVEERTREVRELATTLTMAEQEERRRIARVLHDELQQLLFAVHLRLETLAQQTADRDDISEEFEIVRDWVNQAIRDTRQLSGELSPPVLKSRGLADALEWLAEQMREKHGLRVWFELDSSLSVPDEDLRSLLFQCTRELLFNVVKHAGVTEATVSASRAPRTVEIVVSDEGAGFEGVAGPGDGGFGLAHMRQRLELIGGALDVESRPGEGTRARISVPIAG